MPQHGRQPGEPRPPSQRQLRVGELIRHAVSDLLTRGEIIDDEVTAMMLTVPEVRVSPDLRNATIFVAPLGGGDGKAAARAMERNKRWIRGQIAHKVNLKFAPEIVFRFDDRFEESAHIDALLHSPEVARDLGPDGRELETGDRKDD